MSWMNTLHGLLFAALGFAWEEDSLPYILSAVGVSVSIITAIGVFAATIEICRLSDWWESNKPDNYTGPGIWGMQGIMKYKYFRLFAPWNLLPIVFLFAWLAVPLMRLC
jgi:vacuolar-type H+-ATPase subunit I/STV1